VIGRSELPGYLRALAALPPPEAANRLAADLSTARVGPDLAGPIVRHLEALWSADERARLRPALEQALAAAADYHARPIGEPRRLLEKPTIAAFAVEKAKENAERILVEEEAERRRSGGLLAELELVGLAEQSDPKGRRIGFVFTALDADRRPVFLGVAIDGRRPAVWMEQARGGRGATPLAAGDVRELLQVLAGADAEEHLGCAPALLDGARAALTAALGR
jgi:hypothetical protein